jgi:hypothetical protein
MPSASSSGRTMPKGSTRRTGQRAEERDLSPEERYPNWPPPRRPAPTLARTFLPLARRHGGVTVAHVTWATGCPFREAVTFLASLQRAGRVVRSGGGPGKALVWSLPPAST